MCLIIRINCVLRSAVICPVFTSVAIYVPDNDYHKVLGCSGYIAGTCNNGSRLGYVDGGVRSNYRYVLVPGRVLGES